LYIDRLGGLQCPDLAPRRTVLSARILVAISDWRGRQIDTLPAI
jgi:hypothetical protein